VTLLKLLTWKKTVIANFTFSTVVIKKIARTSITMIYEAK